MADAISTLKFVDFLTLKVIAHEIMPTLVSKDFRDQFNYQDYHGFMKARLPEAMLTSILSPRGLNTNDVQIEIAYVTTDLTDQVHYHSDATAYIIVLGSDHHFPTPRDAYMYLHDGWMELKEGDAIKIPANSLHGFTVKTDGQLFFLTVQSPAIVRTDGEDDYHVNHRIPLESNIKPRNNF